MLHVYISPAPPAPAAPKGPQNIAVTVDLKDISKVTALELDKASRDMAEARADMAAARKLSGEQIAAALELAKKAGDYQRDPSIQKVDQVHVDVDSNDGADTDEAAQLSDQVANIEAMIKAREEESALESGEQQVPEEAVQAETARQDDIATLRAQLEELVQRLKTLQAARVHPNPAPNPTPNPQPEAAPIQDAPPAAGSLPQPDDFIPQDDHEQE